MKNLNYNLIKLLHNSLDDSWRVEKHCLKDARSAGCKSCQKLLAKMRTQFKGNTQALQREISRHMGRKGKLE
jgi:hypothetical protein